MSRYTESIDSSEVHRLLTVYLALAANQMARARELLDTGETELYQPALLAREQAEFALRAGDSDGAIDWLQRSISRIPLPDTVRRLVGELLSNDRSGQALLLFDTYEWQGMSAADVSRIEQMTGLHGEDLLTFLNKLTDAALEMTAYDTAISYDRYRTDLADQLGLEAECRQEEIERIRQEHAPPSPPIRIEQTIANETTGEDR
jgi:hypothetical protein